MDERRNQMDNFSSRSFDPEPGKAKYHCPSFSELDNGILDLIIHEEPSSKTPYLIAILYLLTPASFYLLYQFSLFHFVSISF
jgi:hypothetical protein